MIGDRAKQITGRLYLCYGTDSGCLLGLSPDQRHAVEAIVQFVLDDAFEAVQAGALIDRRAFLALPVTERRKLLLEQAQKLANMSADSDAMADKGMME